MTSSWSFPWCREKRTKKAKANELDFEAQFRGRDFSSADATRLTRLWATTKYANKCNFDYGMAARAYFE